MLKTKVIKDWSKVEEDNKKILGLGDYKYGIETYTLQNKELIRQSGRYIVCNAQGKAMNAEVFIYAEGGRIELQATHGYEGSGAAECGVYEGSGAAECGVYEGSGAAECGVGSADGVFVYTGGLKKFKDITGEKEVSRGRKYNNWELLPEDGKKAWRKIRSGGKDWWVNETLEDVVYFTDEKYIEMLAKSGNGSKGLFDGVRGVYWESDF